MKTYKDFLDESSTIPGVPKVDQEVYNKKGEVGYYQGAKKAAGRITHLIIKWKSGDKAEKIEKFQMKGNEFHIK